MPRKCQVSEVWCASSCGTFKSNVNGLARGFPGLAGMGGVLRDSVGKVLCLFSIFLGSQDTNAAKIMSIGKACELISMDSNFVGCPIFIISDSKVVVSLVNNEVFGNIKQVNLIYDIRIKLKSLGNMSEWCLALCWCLFCALGPGSLVSSLSFWPFGC
ncbi:hypothetical protein Dsin_020219 [Dipteronia sinensis]|uniref:RNase H type-1 domain-containing protein n=1 Tax=Dipteronia sinensis TaxID=43782 RepID=A0AAE0E3J4_9ROSI|nr:hypothetical protein Dsin_020219 [Dipteronia sinensis]